MEEVVPEAPAVPVSDNSFNFNFLLNTNMYIAYIVLILVVLIAIGIYLYRKYFVKTKTIEKLENTEKQILDPTKEYYLKDNNNKEILLNSFFNDIIKNKQVNKDELIQKLQNDFQQLQMEKQQVQQMQQQLSQQAQMMQLQAKQMQQHASQVSQQNPLQNPLQNPQQNPQQNPLQHPQQHPQQTQQSFNAPVNTSQQQTDKKQRPKLAHPKDKSDNLGLSEIEDENIAALNLTNEEMAELKKQILALKKSQNKHISAQNDEMMMTTTTMAMTQQ
jgi:hypothetical protein